jgi:hypothetical protein
VAVEVVYCRRKMRTLTSVTLMSYFRIHLDKRWDYSRIFCSRVEVGVNRKLSNFIYIRIL